jgi:hypothetical protein
VTDEPYQGSLHIEPQPKNLTLTYSCSNPPASGRHFPSWGKWGVHSKPLPRGNYVHNLEHGGVVLLHRCDSCPEIVSQLEAVVTALTPDPKCDPFIGTRTVITADPLIDHPIAAAAWLSIYTADCVDPVTLTDFINAHYDLAPESFCSQGQIQ